LENFYIITNYRPAATAIFLVLRGGLVLLFILAEEFLTAKTFLFLPSAF
jgi:hypothetical protein